MALGPRLDLRQSQSLVMTPQLQQAIKLLALSNLEIETFIGEALESNPLLEAGEVSREAGDDAPDAVADGDTPPDAPTSDELMLAGGGEGDAPLDLDPAALDIDRDTGDWSAAPGSGGGEDGPDISEHGDVEADLAAHLETQVGPAAPNVRTAFIARHIIGLLDDAGYLAASLRDLASDLNVPLAEAEAALELVQSLDPTGVGARSLAECLALQAKEADRYDPCMEVLLANLDLLAKGSFAQLKRICDVDDEDFADMLGELRSYDPKPGLKFARSDSAPVTPDVLIRASSETGWDIQLNQATLPRLIINREYYVELRGGCTDKQSKGWLSEKLADANWLVKALDQRQKTILKVASEIVKQQDGFFRRGVSELKPLTLAKVAEAIEMHESTVSRVTSNKYLHCERGTFELKYFFTSGVGGGADGEGASAEAVKARIKALTDAEDPKKILSDDKLVELLKAEGFDLARRTVAKYREAIGIGSSVQRRRQKKLESI
ncbi:RNA polymerase factor sigma-54 [Alteraurantiacibacter aquimixticola]|uniref:RNA polymerase sigma-54 factor n=1 Tax=Alteraurantiacibacter aquimixticola TaxID=2489173 RepID=A0A4T3F1Y9_9SPHN|nr:RNA polymerase factor sigma-54 [Alteraurantiacibacter aquimixticola]TIX49425.1 RNA polymerase factor sigma-54 [Alteraurantiacibacter aquimixticola]